MVAVSLCSILASIPCHPLADISAMATCSELSTAMLPPTVLLQMHIKKLLSGVLLCMLPVCRKPSYLDAP